MEQTFRMIQNEMLSVSLCLFIQNSKYDIIEIKHKYLLFIKKKYAKTTEIFCYHIFFNNHTFLINFNIPYTI